MHHARGDLATFRKTLSEGVSLFLFISGGAFAVFTFLLVGFVNFSLPWLNRPLEGWEAWVLGLLGANFLLLSIPGGVYVTVYRATGLFSRGAMVGNVIRGLSIGVSVGLLCASVQPEVYAAGMLGMGALLTCVVVWDTRRCIPACRGLRIRIAKARKGWTHLGGAIHFWLMALAQTAIQQGVLLILAAVTSPAVVALYATHRTLANIPNYIRIVLQGPLLPELSFLWAQDRLSDLRRTTFITIRNLLLSTGVVAIFLWLVAPFIYPIWTGRHLQIQPMLLGLLLVQGVLAAGWTPSTWSLLATNHHRPLAVWSLANAAITVGLAAWLAVTHGAVGIVLAVLVGDLVCGLAVFPVLASSFLKVSSIRIYFEISLTTIMLLPLAGIVVLMSTFLRGWWSVSAFILLGMGLAYPMLRFVIGREEVRNGLEMLRVVWSWRA
jgi:O-antigen/teichoic acid export membrane protein